MSKFAVFVDLENCGAKVATLNSILEKVKMRGDILLGRVYGYTDRFSDLKQILLSNTAYLNAHTQTDIEWKTRGKAKSIEEFTALYASQIQDFTDEEKKALDAYISIDEARFNYLGIRLPTTGEVTFIKCTMEYITQRCQLPSEAI